MGRYYAEAAGLPQEVANACEMHYSPLGPSDDVPTEAVSIAVALADKLDMLTGFWGIDEKPTGSKDPFALRRAALGIIRIILTNDLRFPLERFIDRQLLEVEIQLGLDTAEEKDLYFLEQMVDQIAHHGVFGAAFRALFDKFDKEDKSFEVAEGTWLSRLQSSLPETSDSLLGFFYDRLKVHLKSEGITHDVIDACLAMPGSDDLTLLVKRVNALQVFVKTDDGENLLQGYKRANNILAAEEKKDGVSYEGEPELQYAESSEEKALFAALDAGEMAISTALTAEDFADAMAAMASLRAPIDAFFDSTQVNAEAQVVRRNRLCLLNRIRAVMHKVAIFSALNG